MADRYELLRTNLDAGRSDLMRAAVSAERHRTEARRSEVAVPLTEGGSNMIRAASGHRRSLLLVAASGVLVVAAVVGIAVVSGDDEPDAPAVRPTAPTSTAVEPQTSPSSTGPVTDLDVAAGTLLLAGEYAPGWSVIANDTAPFSVGFDPAKADRVPECAQFVESVFAHVDRGSHLYRLFFHADPAYVWNQFVVVLPSPHDAASLLSTVTGPEFASCARAYDAAQVAPCGAETAPLPSAFGEPTVTAPFDADADDVVYRIVEFSCTDASGTRFVETVHDVAVRVGRVITFIQMTRTGNDGGEVQTDEQFGNAVGRAIERANAALEGDPIPQV